MSRQVSQGYSFSFAGRPPDIGQLYQFYSAAEGVEWLFGRVVILRVDSPEPGKWKVHLAGTGLFVLSIAAKTPIKLTAVQFFESGAASLESSNITRLEQPGWARGKTWRRISRGRFRA